MLGNICTGLGLPAFARLFGDIFVVCFIFNKNAECIVISNFIYTVIILIQIMLETLKLLWRLNPTKPSSTATLNKTPDISETECLQHQGLL
jgi:hypothetical protein